jgi:hypothetical protein
VIAYKFLCAGGVGPFSRHAWPLPSADRPGAWVTAPAEPTLCATAVHGCRVADLPWWLQDELWEAEFDGAVATGRHKISAARARLLRPVEGWDRACAQRFADACALRARDHAVAALERAGDDRGAAVLRERSEPRDVMAAVRALAPPEAARITVTMAGDAARRARSGHAVVAAYIAAHAAARLDGRDAMGAERAWQADWLRAELRLAAD